MTDLTAAIERVVREVLAQMSASARPAPHAHAAQGAGGCACGGAKTDQPAATDCPCGCGGACKTLGGGECGVFRVASRLVTLAELPPDLDGLKQIVVPAQAVVTPAVRDALKQRRVALTYAFKAPPAGKTPPAIAVAVAETKFHPVALVRSLSLDGAAVERSPAKDLPAAVDALASALSRHGAIGLLLTDNVSTALCLANRLPGVRAITAAEPGELRRAAAGAGANVLAMAPRKLGFFSLKRLAAQFALESPYPVPAAYAQALE